jgi:O-antigen/teichoic acid export membrane protein
LDVHTYHAVPNIPAAQSRINKSMSVSPVVPSTNRIRVHPFFQDLGLTAITAFSVLMASLLLVSLFGRLLGPLALGEYLLLRRVVSWLQPAVQLGLGTALPRYVAYETEGTDTNRGTYFFIALGFGIAAACVLGVIFRSHHLFFARLFFGNERMSNLLLPLTLMIMGFAMHSSVYGYYRGRLFMRLANGLEFSNLAAVPLVTVAFFFRTGSVSFIVTVIGLSMCVCSILFGLPIFWKCAKHRPVQVRRRTSEMLNYGLPRLAGEFALGGMMALAPIVASHYVQIGRVAYLLLGASMLTVFATSVAPLGVILLSKASTMISQGRIHVLRTRLDYLVAAILEMSIFGALQLIVFAGAIVKIWVGGAFAESTLVIRLLLLGVPFYVFYVALRSVIDATSITAFNSRNILAALTVFVVLLTFTVGTAPRQFLLEGIAVAWMCGLAVLGWLTARTLRTVLGLTINYAQIVGPAFIAVVLAGASFSVHWLNGFHTGVAGILLVELVTGTTFLACLAKLGGWLPYAWKTIFQKRAVSEISLVET